MPILPALPYCHRSITSSRCSVASFRLPEKGSQAPNPSQKPGQAQPSHGLPPGLEAWPCLFHSCWFRGGSDGPSMPGPSLGRGGLEWERGW